VRDAKNNLPDGAAAQAKQCLENVKAIIEAANLTMEHVVHMQLYLEKVSDLAEVDKAYASYFPNHPPARVVLGVAKMPTDTTIEMTAVVVRDLKQKKVLALKSLTPLGHASSAIQVGPRVYFSGVYGHSASEAEAQMKKVLAEARLKSAHVVLSNFYGVTASALIPMRELPNQMQAAYSVIAAKKVARVKQSATYCAADGDTVFCSVQLGNEAANKTVPDQVKAAMQKLYAGLESHGAKLSMVTASNVYLDDIKEFAPMNQTYATFFTHAPPTRTTVQPFSVSDRTNGNPPLVRISVVAVKE
jgi:enamine deaminase RidA (YjgF/YER057c/UK114 family)